MTEIIVPNMKNSSVLINGVALSGVRLVKAYEDREFYQVRELLNGETEQIPKSESYRIVLGIGMESQFYFSGDFTFTVSTPEYVKTYSGCRITQVEEVLRAPNSYELQYNITAKKKAQIER